MALDNLPILNDTEISRLYGVSVGDLWPVSEIAEIEFREGNRLEFIGRVRGGTDKEFPAGYCKLAYVFGKSADGKIFLSIDGVRKGSKIFSGGNLSYPFDNEDVRSDDGPNIEIWNIEDIKEYRTLNYFK